MHYDDNGSVQKRYDLKTMMYCAYGSHHKLHSVIKNINKSDVWNV